MGETFWQFRQYQAGDAAELDRLAPVRALAPPVRARAGMGGGRERLALVRPVRLRWRSAPAPALPLKWERAALLTLALAGLLVRGGERVALLGGGERPATGRYGMETLIRCLVAAAADQRDAAAPLPPLPRHARLVLLSDFLLPLDQLAERFGQFSGLGARAGLMQIVDPAEEQLPYEGRVLFEGMEREGTALIDHVGGIRARYAELFRAHRETLAGHRRPPGLALHQPPHRRHGRAGPAGADGHARPAHGDLTMLDPRPPRLHPALAARCAASPCRPCGCCCG